MQLITRIKKTIISTVVTSFLVTTALVTTVNKCAQEAPTHTAAELEAIKATLATIIPPAEQDHLNTLLFENIKHPEKVKEILDQGASPNAGGGITIIAQAIRSNNLEVTRILIEAGANLNAANKWYYPPLTAATNMINIMTNAAGLEERIMITKELIKEGADINKGTDLEQGPLASNDDFYGMTPLMIAMKHGSGCTSSKMHVHCSDITPEIIHLLIESGADETLKNKAGRTAMDMAREGLHQQAIEALQQAVAIRDSIPQPHQVHIACDYLVDKPLSISPLVTLFTLYASIESPVKRAKERAAQSVIIQEQRLIEQLTKVIALRMSMASESRSECN